MFRLLCNLINRLRRLLPYEEEPAPAWFEASWYLKEYPDVAAAGMDPWHHYCRFGKAEGRLPTKNRALAMDHALWRGADAVMLPKLYRLLGEPGALEHEQLSARWALSRWRAWQKDWSGVVSLLAPAGEIIPVISPLPLLLLTEALCRLRLAGYADHFEALTMQVLQRLQTQFPNNTDAALAKANIQLAADAKTTERLDTINQIYRHYQLPLLCLKDESGVRLHLDNLAAHHAPCTKTSTSELVSVVIPLFNAETTIETTLRSLFAQTWPNLEILIVDDASTDSSWEVVQALLSECPGTVSIRCLKQPVNQGAYAARNAALAVAKGDLITVHDSDDWSHPSKIALQVDALRQQTKAMASISCWVRVTDDLLFHRWRLDDACWVYPNISSLMFRREVLETLGYWDQVRVNADTEYKERIQAAYGQDSIVTVLPEVPLSFGRADEGSLSQHSATHLVTQFDGVRYQYMEAARGWHSRARSPNDLYLASVSNKRPFPVPDLMLHAKRKRCEEALSCEVLAKDQARLSSWFDAGWYLERYIHLQQTLIDPFEHFWVNAKEHGYDPGPDFSCSGYMRANPEARNAANPMEHFLNTGYKSSTRPIWYGQAMRAGRPTIMLCGHQAGPQLFGAERSFLSVVAALSELGFNLVVTLPEALNQDYEESLLRHCQVLAVLPYGWWQEGRKPVEATVEHFKQLITDFEVSAVHANTLVLDEPLRAARALGKPALVHVRELPDADVSLCDTLGCDAEVIIRHATALADRLLANSQYTAGAVQSVAGDDLQVDVIPNTFDLAPFLAIPVLPRTGQAKALRVGMLSSNQPKKGLADVEQLALFLAARSADIELVLVGPETSALLELLEREKAAGASGLITYYGYVESPAQVMGELDVVINLSHFQESFGRTVLEAMASARPVVAYDWGAIPELVVQAETGWLVPFRQVEGVAEYLVTLSDSREQIQTMGLKGRERARQLYGADAAKNALCSVYEKTLGVNSAR